MSTREAVTRYLCGEVAEGHSARGVLGRIRRTLVAIARSRHREDFTTLLQHSVTERIERAKAVAHAIDVLRSLPAPQPQVSLKLARRSVVSRRFLA
ncbi:hypothetical protein [Caballeronia sordidicola]|uniref:Mobile element protein n=1 Tax=Caballeronia sordidicola TaxID=196367 RepID=A0A226WUU3_CABSO|nr:hypothetical protein [Caballeronia sordidicola]OXC74863.1 Mobile element protein [Caballeronia sordidicola]